MNLPCLVLIFSIASGAVLDDKSFRDTDQCKVFKGETEAKYPGTYGAIHMYPICATKAKHNPETPFLTRSREGDISGECLTEADINTKKLPPGTSVYMAPSN